MTKNNIKLIDIVIIYIIFDMFSLKKGINIFQNVVRPMNLTKIEFSYETSKEDEEYNLQADVAHYYDSTIKAEGIITIDEFFALCIEMGIK